MQHNYSAGAKTAEDITVHCRSYCVTCSKCMHEGATTIDWRLEETFTEVRVIAKVTLYFVKDLHQSYACFKLFVYK